MSQEEKLQWHVGDSLDLIEFVRLGLKDGYGFVPLFGAGVSDDSGVPLIWELEQYLSHCVLRAVGLSSFDGKGLRTWNPREDKWPPVGGAMENRFVTGIPDEVLANAIKAERERGSGKDRRRLQLLQEASGAIAEWRTSLLFLSRLRSDGNGTRLGVPDDEVIDRFFRNSTSGRRPGMIHRMLTQLADPMRFRSLLTTNFDELAEDAFAEAGSPLDVFEVPRPATLPSIGTQQFRKRLVKLHGGRYGLRGDYSLDADPTEQEYRNFASYFAGRSIGSPDILSEWYEGDESTSPFWENHALILGVSAADQRTIKLLRRSMELSGGKMKTIWVQFEETSNANHLGLKEALNEKPTQFAKDADLLLVNSRYQGLLLLRLYQALTLRLPPKFALFPAGSRLRIPPGLLDIRQRERLNYILAPDAPRQCDKAGQSIKQGAARAQKSHEGGEPDPAEARITLIGSTPEVKGLTSRAIFHYQRASTKGHADRCIWLSLEHVSSTDELFEQMTDAISHAAGHFEWAPIVLFDRQEKQISEIDRLTRGRKRWVLFLDVRDGAGTARGTGTVPDSPNGWVDYEPNPENTTVMMEDQLERNFDELDETSANCRDFVDLLKSLTCNANTNLSIVLIYHRTKTERSKEETNLELELRKHKAFENCFVQIAKQDHPEWAFVESTRQYPLDKDYQRRKRNKLAPTGEEGDFAPTSFQYRFDHKRAAAKAKQWALGHTKAVHRQSYNATASFRLHFLIALTCCQRFRYPALLLSDAFSPPHWLHQEGDESDPDSIWALRNRRIFSLGKDSPLGYIPLLNDDEHCVVRRAAGGFVWMHARTRSFLRQHDVERGLGITTVIEQEHFIHNDTKSLGNDPADVEELIEEHWSGDPQIETALSKCLGVPLRYAVFRAHFLSGVWYEELFRSSQHPRAGLEAIEHFLRAAANAATVLKDRADYHRSNPDLNPAFFSRSKNPSPIPESAIAQLVDSVANAARIAEEIKPVALATGQPKATCRAIIHLRVALIRHLRRALLHLLKPYAQKTLRGQDIERVKGIDEAIRSLDDLALTFFRTLRGIAREVSEHNRAFLRHRQYYEYLFTRDIKINQALPGQPHPAKPKEIRDVPHITVAEEIKAVHALLSQEIDDPHDKVPSGMFQEKTLYKAERTDSDDVLTIEGKRIHQVKIRKRRNLALEHARWCCHGATLSLATRSYGYSASELIRAMQLATQLMTRDSDYTAPKIDKSKKFFGRHSQDRWSSTPQGQSDGSPADIVHRALRRAKKEGFIVDPLRLNEDTEIPQQLLRAELVRLESRVGKMVGGELDQTHAEAVLKILCRLVQWCIVSAESVRFATRKELDPQDHIDLGKMAWTVFRHISSMFSQDSETLIMARQVMDTQMSTIFGLEQNWHCAHGLLDSATQLQPKTHSEVPLSLGIVKLHRAQLYLLNARHNRFASQTPPLIPGMRSDILKILNESRKHLPRAHISARPHDFIQIVITNLLLTDRPELLSDFDSDAFNRKVRSAWTLLADAESTLAEAERILLQKRKNVWWSTWVFELQAKVLEYRLMLQLQLSVTDILKAAYEKLAISSRTPEQLRTVLTDAINGRIWPAKDKTSEPPLRHVKDFGVSDAPRGIDMELDQLLTQTQRMVRLDMVRPTRVVETYALCTWGLNLLLMVDCRLDPLPRRQAMMLDRLEAAHDELVQRWEKRQELPPCPDLFVGAYVECVKRLSAEVVSQLQK